jgi:hypothetical protein
MLSVGDKRRTAQSTAGTQAHTCGQFVPQEANKSGAGKRPQLRKLFGMKKALERLEQRNAGGREDGKHDGVAGPSLGTPTA